MLVKSVVTAREDIAGSPFDAIVTAEYCCESYRSISSKRLMAPG